MIQNLEDSVARRLKANIKVTHHIVTDRRSHLKLFKVQSYLERKNKGKHDKDCQPYLADTGGDLAEGVGAGGVRGDGVGRWVAWVL